MTSWCDFCLEFTFSVFGRCADCGQRKHRNREDRDEQNSAHL